MPGFRDYNEFFRLAGEHFLGGELYGVTYSFTIEEMYQYFRNRLMDETAVSNPGLRMFGRLVDISKND
jgi:hypothetical protein